MSSPRWTGFVASRWFRSGRDSGPSLAPATAGIAVGVAALLCVIGVMNGFQMGFIEAVLDLDSYHVRVDASGTNTAAVLALLPDAVAAMSFADVRTLVMSADGSASPLRVKVIPDDAAEYDPGFMDRLEFKSGSLEGGIAIGSELSRSLDLRVGDTVSVLSVTADEEQGVSAGMVELRVAGVFHSGYYDFDSNLAFLPRSQAAGLDSGEPGVIGVKLRDRYRDAEALRVLEGAGLSAESWRSYNKAFFGALRMEKSIMMALVSIIFLVVGVNIFHSMRKAVYARVEDIATIRALGAGADELRGVFMLNGAVAGGLGALIGLAAGLLVALNVNAAFAFLEKGIALVFGLFGGSSGAFSFFSPDLFYIGDVPVRLPFGEVLFITAAGALSALAAARAASSRVTSILPSEVLRDE